MPVAVGFPSGWINPTCGEIVFPRSKFRVFDLIYALTGGGPGTATEPVSLYGFTVLFQNLRFGYGSAIAVIVFVVTFGLALLYVRTVGAGLLEEER